MSLIYQCINLFPIITYFFLLFTPSLASPIFETRDLAHEFLSFCRPFSDIAIIQNCSNEDPEISFRSNQLIKAGFAWELDYNAYFIVKDLIYGNDDDSELPWLPQKFHDQYASNLRIKRALKYYIMAELGRDWFLYEGSTEYLTGVDDARFVVRGLENPSNYYTFSAEKEIPKWKELRKEWKGK